MEDNDKSKSLLENYKKEEEDSCLVENSTKEMSKNLNPLDSYKISLNTDFYTLAWCCIKKKAFCSIKVDETGNQILDDSNTIKGERIYLLPEDYFMLYFHFLVFISTIIISFTCILKEQAFNDEYVEGSLFIIICRIILTFFVYLLLGKEFKQGWGKLEYTINNRDQFTYIKFAIFIAIFQVISASIAFICIVISVCLNGTITDLLFNFSALAVLTELDDWLGSAILAKKIKKDTEDSKSGNKIKNERYVENLNERMGILDKMAIIDDSNYEIIVNGDLSKSHSIFRYIDIITSHIPFQILIPFLTIPLSIYLPQYSKFVRHNFR